MMAENSTQNNKDSFQQLFSRLQRLLLDETRTMMEEQDGQHDDESNLLCHRRRSRSYVVLVQHSLSFQLRQQAATATTATESAVTPSSAKTKEVHDNDDETTLLYRRAGLRTPAENAVRDLESGWLWLQHITNKLCSEYSSVLWLRTSTRSSSHPTSTWLTTENLQVIDAASDPYGWDCDPNANEEQEEGGSRRSSSSSVQIGNLDTITNRIEEEIRQLQKQQTASDSEKRGVVVPVPSVIESLTPLLQRHGLNRTIRFVRKVASLCCPLVVPILTEILTPVQHRQFEDMASAMLSINNGEAVLLREGIREKGNLVRENIHYSIVVDNKRNGRGGKRIELISEGREEAELQNETKEVLNDNEGEQSAFDPTATTKASRGGEKPRHKVHLQLEEDSDGSGRSKLMTGSSTTPAAEAPQPNKPRIYLQDDDPEFDDYDEEDPDDDLDL